MPLQLNPRFVQWLRDQQREHEREQRELERDAQDLAAARRKGDTTRRWMTLRNAEWEAAGLAPPYPQVRRSPARPPTAAPAPAPKDSPPHEASDLEASSDTQQAPDDNR